jgi:hypothetical protein
MELNIGIICASLPTLRALLAKFFPRLFKVAVISRAKAQDAYRSHDSAPRKYANRREDSGNFDERLADGAILIKSEIDVEVGQNSYLASDSDAEITSVTRPEPVRTQPTRTWR